MKLADLAKKPQLIKITIDEADIVAKYGEAVEFWTWDRQPMDTFLKMANIDSSNYRTIVEVVRELILDDKGQAVIKGDDTLPADVLNAAVFKILENLGK